MGLLVYVHCGSEALTIYRRIGGSPTGSQDEVGLHASWRLRLWC
jgi:hypothetical protein